ncbi:MAG: decarboxylase [Candidatus Rokuibacteriota bacterium]|nr:MAG: decarboxylase [Candidatus Rokubacteria bacterium]PYN64498.1 MAG: decarboxylase [Candidatus Rokubacteria bacterium]
MTAPTQPTTSLDLKDFFSAAEARSDRWRQLNAAGRAWETAVVQGHPEDKLHAEAARLLREIVALEHYWAYPGPRLMGAVGEAVEERNAGVFARLLQKISSALVTGSYRHEGAAWDPLQDGEARPELLVPDAQQGDGHKPYFEVLVVTPTDPSLWERGRNDLKRLRRPEDPFVYEVVQVATFEDAVLGTIFNANVQAVVIHDGFLFHSRHDLPVLRQFLLRHLSIDPATTAPGELAVTLARAIKNYRPELDVYLLTDRAVEQLAGSEEAAPLRRVFHSVEEIMEIHLAVLDGVGERYETPFFANLKKYAQRPIGTFHALPIARGKSIFRSNWIRDMGHFYGTNLFLAESSATTGGLDSLLEPTGNIKKAHELAARAFGARRAYFGTNGTSTSNKIVVQALCKPGDIVIVDRNCHKSHHYGLVLAGAQPYYVEAYPLTQFSMYGAVPLRTIKKALLDCKAEGKLDRVKVIDLTNCTFDGHMYNPRRVMEECLAIKPDLVFLWDEAWFGFARFTPFHRRRTAMGAAAALAARYREPAYREAYKTFAAKVAALGANTSLLLDMPLLPDPDKVRIRVYQTNSTHKSMSALRQGSMILVWDDDFHQVEGPFEEAFFTHTSTSPNQQIIASLDLARRQMELEGYDLTMKATELALRIRREVNNHRLIAKYFRIATPADMIPAEFRASKLADYGPPQSTWKEVIEAWNEDEFALDPTRLTLICGAAGFDGTQFKNLLADRFDIQLNKTSRNSVLVQTNINNTRSDAALLIKVLADLSREIEQRLAQGGVTEQVAFAARVKSLMTDVPDLPNFSRFHDAFRDNAKAASNEGHMRSAYFMAYDDANCEFIKLGSKEIDDRLGNGPELVSANFVIPYPPGFPIMVPGQVITAETIAFMRKLDVKEIHGYHAAHGLKLLTPAALASRNGKRAEEGGPDA